MTALPLGFPQGLAGENAHTTRCRVQVRMDSFDTHKTRCKRGKQAPDRRCFAGETRCETNSSYSNGF